MTFDPEVVETVCVDSYGTLVDVDGAEDALARRIDEPGPISRLRRARSLEYALVSNFIDASQPFHGMDRDALAYALEPHGVDLPESEREEVLAVYHELAVFEDVRPGIARLHEAGHPVYVLSNGDPGMLGSMTTHAGIDDLLSGTLSAAEVETFKPDPELYRHAVARVGTPIDRIAHVSAGWLDVQGTKHAGMQRVWIDRTSAPWEPFDGEPDLVVDTIHGVVDRLTRH